MRALVGEDANSRWRMRPRVVWMVIPGTSRDGKSTWASLRQAVIWSALSKFFFPFDSRLDVGVAVSIRFRDQDFGMATVSGSVASVSNLEGSRRVIVVGNETRYDEVVKVGVVSGNAGLGEGTGFAREMVEIAA